ncbi:type II secretion system protein [Beggiatoa leptomitoformis]|uniref:Prepilin-type N-terminal cleavage/methylation domain-containing protein n=1 Tax=Beggiatoa leptomitoformis TaxID=288004 RepID=A0A2N9YCI4_9GAMM|nr:prepilin-type N-terminal cleavage/methylation domain-containing protein [Beggiatoa leptomitoformis]ALG66522.1 prepilin-type N-terminal cleavage/methylation domain-containing protein [Beggiatoa leptomitoformis]AUI68181.1 prepilin-type N-terminal cleavage/methylation domain-containing protein [Beggiatoa leptomitoformis]
MKRQQSGFTLVEIAIVLVIIGLLIGGVLKGQEIITNARVVNIENSFNGISAAIFSYQDRYRALPGDDAKANIRFPAFASASGTVIGSGNGIIEGQFKSTTDTDESRLFWLHLRNAGLVPGAVSPSDLNSFEQPTNPYGGKIGVSSDPTVASTKPANITGMYVGFAVIPGKIAQILETRADDTVPDTGSVQALKNSDDSAVTTKYDPLEIYDVFLTL